MKIKNLALFVSIVHTILFIPFFTNGYISSDWDSYALIGSAKIFLEQDLYIPSRPPGFPLSELLTITVVYLSEILNLSFEKILLLTQYVFLTLCNFLIYKLLKMNNSRSNIYYLIMVASPIYIISGFTVIDYMGGLFFGFLGIYLFKNSKEDSNLFFISLIFAISIGFRLSNIIFLASLIIFLIFKEQKFIKALNIIFITGGISLFIYGIAYWSLWENSLQTIYTEDITEIICIFNLTNTDHSLISRLGRFVIKQTNYLSVVGSILFIVNIFKLKHIKFSENIIYLSIFTFFQLSFLRLPTEEEHLLPAFIALFLILSNSDINISYKKIILFIVFLSNFLNLNFYEVDEIDNATLINFNSDIKSGLLIEDYETRNEKGQNKEFHYENSVDTLINAWKYGCPN